jgi:hypothetical protein
MPRCKGGTAEKRTVAEGLSPAKPKLQPIRLPSQLFFGAGEATLLRQGLRRGRSELLEARIIPERIEHWIEPEQCRSERRS